MLAAGAGSIAAAPLESEETILADANADTASRVLPVAGRGVGLVPEGSVLSSVILTVNFDEMCGQGRDVRRKSQTDYRSIREHGRDANA